MRCSITKEQVIKSTLLLASYGAAFTLGLFIPDAIALAIGIDLTDSYCNKNANICNQFQYPDMPKNDNITLSIAVKGNAYFDSVLNSIAGAFLLCLFLGICKVAYDYCKERQKNKNQNQSTPLLKSNQTINQRCSFFKKFKEKILPTPVEMLQLAMTTIGLIGISSFLTWLVALDLSGTICSPAINSDTGCAAFFPNATIAEQHSLEGFSNKAYNSIMSSGIIFGVLINIGIAVGAMALAAGVKYCAQRVIDKRAEEHNANVNVNTAFSSNVF